MEVSYKTEQEKFWATDFGDKYVERNTYKDLLPAYIYEWSQIISKTNGIKSCIEFGSNIGANLKAIQTLLPNVEISAIEINHCACENYLKKFIKPENIFNQSILDYLSTKKHDLAFVKGVLIHINPDELQNVYEKLYNASNKYILIAEYYNQTPIMIDYRGNKDRLFKRDFAGEILDKYPDLKLIDYGFFYNRDSNFKVDDINWFLMEK